MSGRSDIELLNLCASDYLSLDSLQETINNLGPQLSSQDPSCFHKACSNENATLKIVQILYNMWPEALRLRDEDGDLPVHNLCCNADLDETASLDIQRFMLEIDPTLVREEMGDGSLPIQYAVRHKSTAFCKILIDAYPESLRIKSGGELPIHSACYNGRRDDTSDTIQYMLEVDSGTVFPE